MIAINVEMEKSIRNVSAVMEKARIHGRQCGAKTVTVQVVGLILTACNMLPVCSAMVTVDIILIAKNVLMVLWLKNVLFAKETTVRIVQIANLREYRALNV